MSGPESMGIAVIGLAGRFPEAADIVAYWDLLRDGREAVVSFSNEELLAAGVDSTLLQNPNYVKSGTVVPGIEDFDADFFKMSALDAEVADPQHRVLWECCWQAMEHAGYPPSKKGQRIGLYAGVGENTYRRHYLEPNMDRLSSTVGEYRIATLNGVDFPATYAAYKLNLKGPAMSVQTACSTSLVAVHLACQSLLNFECDMVLAGGVSVFLPQKQGYLYQEGMINSPDGHCRAFDAQARGTIGGGGVGVVMLKRLDEAIADGDTIHAVILGSAVNNDGADKMSFAAPSTSGQTDVILEAQAAAGVHPDEITYIEAHGTGTLLGDPIEIQALTNAFRAGTERNGYCAIGSVKTNIGHADVAAGIAGFIKTVLALKHRQIPASLNYTAPNPQIDFTNSPFFVNDHLRDWNVPGNGRLCAGVSAFGIGGTNAHVILAEAPRLPDAQGDGNKSELSWHTLRLSAKTSTALETMSQNLAKHLRNEKPEMANVVFTLETGRQEFSYRRIVVCQDTAEAATLLETPTAQRVVSHQAMDTASEIVFMFPGGGAQFPNMGREMYEGWKIDDFAIYRQQIDRCLSFLRQQFNVDLKPLLFPIDSAAFAEAQRLLEKPSLAYPALFVTEYAMARLWQSWGVEPKAMIGHSMGEYTAACLAGVFTLEDALSIVTWRGELYETMPPGAMISVYLSEAALTTRLGERLSIAAVNKHNLCTVSGPIAEIERLSDELTAEGVAWKRIAIAFAGHSPMQNFIMPEFRRRLDRIRFSRPTLPFISNVTGTWIRPEDAMNPDYWVRQMREPVQFSKGTSELLRQRNRLFLEVGPGQTLSPLIIGHADKQNSHSVVASMRHAKSNLSDFQVVFRAVGELWLNAIDIRQPRLSSSATGRRIPLPTYPFERRKYWIDTPGLVTPRSVPAQKPTDTVLRESEKDSSRAGDRQSIRVFSTLEREIAAAWTQSLGTSDIGPDSDFFALGGDSLLATQVAARLRTQMNVPLETHSLLQAPTVTQLAALIIAHRCQIVPENRLPDLVVQLQAGDSDRRPLFLLHPVGGHVYFYRELVRHLDSRIPVYGIHARGVAGDVEPLTTVVEMAQTYVTALQALQPDGPYCLGGSSFGGTLAYAMAQQLIKQGKDVAYLALIDTPSPSHMPEPFGDIVDIIFYMLKVGAGSDIEMDTLRAMDENQQIAFFMQQNEGSFASAHELKTMLKLFKINERAMCDYDPPPYAGKLHFFLARERDAFNAQTPAHGWIDLVSDGIEIVKVPGNHISMNEEPHVQQLARQLEQSLERALSHHSNQRITR